MSGEAGSLKRNSRDSLVYLTTCMIGHLVEAHLKNGSVYSGVFHAADSEKNFGIVLKIASLVKDGTLQGHKSRSEFVRKPPLKTLIIPADELVQVVAKDLSVSSDGKLNAVQSEKSVELLTDSSISKSCHVDKERELKPWVPDGETPERENTGDLHVAEERGLQVNEKLDTDEEAKHSAVRRVDGFDDSGFDEEEDKLLDTCNDQTFGGSSTSNVQKPTSSSGQKPTLSSGKGYGGDSQPDQNIANVDQSCSKSDDHAGQLSNDFPARGSSTSESQLGERRNNNNPEVAHSNRLPEASVSGHGDIKEGANLGGGGTSALNTVAEKGKQVSQVSGKPKCEISFGQSASRRSSESGPAPSTSTSPGLSPSSSVSSLPSSEKPILNPNAKVEQFEVAMSGEAGSLKRHSRDSLVYLRTCMIGHLVEAHLKNGSVYSGIFHAADVEKDFGIVLKMVSLVKDGTLRGHKSRSEFVRKPPFKTMVIPADELVQVVAKDLSVLSDGKLNAAQSEKSVELLTDSSISKSCHVGPGRELKPWVPDGEAPEGLDNVFDESKRGWDQFAVNEELFGVKSTFSEEMYTTKLYRGSRTKKLEEKALRIASEIEREKTGDLHVAEERGLQVSEKFDTDEEAKYSAVRRVDEEEDKLLDTCNDQTFGGSSNSNVQKPTLSSGKGYGGDSQPDQNIANVDQSCSKSDDHAEQLSARGSSTSESQLGERRNNNTPEVAHSNRSPEASVSGHGDIKEGANLGGGGTSALKTVAEKGKQVSQVSGKPKSEISFGQSASRRSSESGPAPSTSTSPGLSPSSSVSSLPSEKFILNPNAKEFKPLQSLPAPVRPQSPISGGSFYYPAPPPAPVHQRPLVLAGYGIQPQYPGQPQYPRQPQLLRYPGHEYPQTYYPPNAPPQYQQQQQQMMQGQQPMPIDMVYWPLHPPYQPRNPHNQG